MDKICHESCTGCECCLEVCPVQAITMTENRKGFFYPTINQEKCIDCGKCEKVCPINNDSLAKKKNTSEVYAAWNKQSNIRQSSSSGGIFTLLATTILQKKGVVFGARWTDKISVQHDFCEKIEDLEKFRRSKYIQSRIDGSYTKVKYFLDSGRIVLFSGTPCQIAGLLSFLGKKYDNLFTVDLVCHGVPNQQVFNKYLNYLENIHKGKVTQYIFRYKYPTWGSSSVIANFDNGKKYIESVLRDPYFIGFAGNYFLRDSCHNCHFASCRRNSDLTICDFWGFRPQNFKMVPYNQGISAILVNTAKGKLLLDENSDYLRFEKRTIKEVKIGNQCLDHSFVPHNQSSNFWVDYLNGDSFETVKDKYFISYYRYTWKHKVMDTIYPYRFLVPEFIINFCKFLLKK